MGRIVCLCELLLDGIQKLLSGGYPEFLLTFQGLFQFLLQSENQEIERCETSFAPKGHLAASLDHLAPKSCHVQYPSVER